MRKGVILEVDDLFITCMTAEGEFMRSLKLQQDYQVGEEIHFIPMEVERVKKPNFLERLIRTKGRAASLAVAMILIVTVLVPMYQSRQVYAYMSIDVNPSIEMELNDKLKVINMKAYNEDGEKVIEKLTNWKQQAVVIVAEKALKEIDKQGYLNEQKSVLISTVNSDNRIETVDGDLKETAVEIQKSQEEQFAVTIVTGTAMERETALKKGVTTGIYKATNKNQTQPNQEKPTRKSKSPVEKAVPQKGESNNNSGQEQKKENKETESELSPNNGSNSGAKEKKIEGNKGNPEHRTDNYGQFQKQNVKEQKKEKANENNNARNNNNEKSRNNEKNSNDEKINKAKSSNNGNR